MVVVDNSMINGIQYHGAEPKLGVSIRGHNYILKQQKRDWNNVLSEYVASRFIQACNIPVHRVVLAQYNESLCVLCEDFTPIYGELKEFSSISSSFDTDKSKHDYYFNEVLYLMSRLQNVDQQYSISGFWKMYIMDAILGNPDRHMGNWGMCKNNGIYRISPIYDNGASLFPRAKKLEVDKEWMYERTYTFPNSKFMFSSRQRSSYKEVLQSGICPAEILNLAKELNYSECINWATAGLLPELRSFYATVVHYRFNSIILNKRFSWKGMVQI